MPAVDSMLIQVARETIWGTGVAQTTRLMGVSDFKLAPEVNARILGATRGSFAPGTAMVITDIASAASFTQEVSYEDMTMWLEMLFGTVTPSGAGPYMRAYAAPSATAPTPVSYTIAYGDSTIGAYRLLGALINDLTLSGTVGDIVQVSGNIRAKAIATVTLGALSDRTVNPAMMHQLGGVFVDAWGGAIGSTALANSLYGFELKVTAEKKLRRYAGSVSPTVYNQSKWAGGTLRLDVDYNATTKAIVDEYLAASAAAMRQIRLKFSDTANRDLQIDFAGGLVEPPPMWDDDDDVAVNPLTFGGVVNTNLGNWLAVTLKNSIQAAF